MASEGTNSTQGRSSGGSSGGLNISAAGGFSTAEEEGPIGNDRLLTDDNFPPHDDPYHASDDHIQPTNDLGSQSACGCKRKQIEGSATDPITLDDDDDHEQDNLGNKQCRCRQSNEGNPRQGVVINGGGNRNEANANAPRAANVAENQTVHQKRGASQSPSPAHDDQSSLTTAAPGQAGSSSNAPSVPGNANAHRDAGSDLNSSLLASTSTPAPAPAPALTRPSGLRMRARSNTPGPRFAQYVARASEIVPLSSFPEVIDTIAAIQRFAPGLLPRVQGLVTAYMERRINLDLTIRILNFLRDRAILQSVVNNEDGVDIPYPFNLDIDGMSYEELVALAERLGEVRTGLTGEEIQQRLKLNKFCADSKGSIEDVGRCCVCLEDFVNKEELGKLDCGHEFHFKCIEKWLREKNNCPICKRTALAETK